MSVNLPLDFILSRGIYRFRHITTSWTAPRGADTTSAYVCMASTLTPYTLGPKNRKYDLKIAAKITTSSWFDFIPVWLQFPPSAQRWHAHALAKVDIDV